MALAHCTCNKLQKKSTTKSYASHNESLFSSPLLPPKLKHPNSYSYPKHSFNLAPFCVHLLPLLLQQSCPECALAGPEQGCAAPLRWELPQAGLRDLHH